MKTAIITGASSGIGLTIASALLLKNFNVFGISRTVPEISDSNFKHVKCDISDVSELKKCVSKILNTEKNNIHLLINNAGVGFFGLHQDIAIEDIETMIDTNLKAPLILINMLLNELKKTKGFVINISSITAKKISTHGCAYAATKCGLSHFASSLFEEVRKHGVKVVSIHPDITKTNFYENLNFTHGNNADEYIMPECVANAVITVISQREGTVISDITIRPQRNVISKKKQ